MDEKILFGVDGSDQSVEALEFITRLYKGSLQPKLILMHCVVQPEMIYRPEMLMIPAGQLLPLDQQEKMAEALLDEFERKTVALGYPADRIELKFHLNAKNPAREILAEARSFAIDNVLVGRRGLGAVSSFLLGSVSNHVAHHGEGKNIWIADTPIDESKRILVAVESADEARNLAEFTARYFSSVAGAHFTLLHVSQPIPAYLWDDGHILDEDELGRRKAMVESWKTRKSGEAENYLADAAGILNAKGVPDDSIDTLVLTPNYEIGEMLIDFVNRNAFSVIVMGKRSMESSIVPSLGGVASEILKGVNKTLICMVAAPHTR